MEPLTAAGVGQADVKEEILQDRLKQAQNADVAPSAFRPGRQQLPGCNGADGQSQPPGEEKAHARKQDHRGHAGGIHGKHGVAQLDAGVGAAPEGAAAAGDESHNERLCQQRSFMHAESLPFLAVCQYSIGKIRL